MAAHDGVSDDRYKLMFFPEDQSWNLYDLKEDPREMKSVHDDPAYAKVLARMKELYAELKDQYQVSEATRPVPRNKQDWWKKRHRKRLVLGAPLLQQITRLLRDGGELFIQSMSSGASFRVSWTGSTPRPTSS